MYCNVHVLYKMIFSNKFKFCWKQVFSYSCKKFYKTGPRMSCFKAPLNQHHVSCLCQSIKWRVSLMFQFNKEQCYTNASLYALIS